MKRVLVCAALVLATAGVGHGQATPAGTDQKVAAPAGAQGANVTVPVKRIVLFSSGVGFFEHGGKVTGDASTELMFKTEQINDILKSLVVADAGGGLIKSVTYPSQDPLSKTLRSFQIDISGNPPLADLLNQIRGSKVLVALNDEQIEGTVLGVQKKQRAVGNPEKLEDVWQLNLVTPTGIRTVVLEDAKRVDIQDATLQKELQQALAALSQARDKDKKPVVIRFEGQGERAVSMGYVVETPVWKTSYRLMLPEVGSKEAAKLQGWAIVENQTENDWTGVDLTLVGGRPISFIENLYSPLYIPRPVSNPKTYASLRPQTYDEGINGNGGERLALSQDVGELQAGQRQAAGGRGGRAGGGGGGAGGFGGAGRAVAAAPSMAPMSEATANKADISSSGLLADYGSGVASIAAAAKVGEMFQYSVPGVTLARQRSAMLPIVADGVEVDRLSIYNAAVLPRNPLRGVRLKNTSGKYLMGGPVTVMSTEAGRGSSYAGDAKIDDVPVGQERLLSFGVDQEMVVDATKLDQTENMVTGAIVKGVLQVKYKAVNTRDYVIENKSDREKTVVIEDPVYPPYELVEPAKALEKTDSMYRFQTTVPAKKSGTFTVKKQWNRGEGFAILPMDVGTIDFYVKNGVIPENVKKALQSVAARKQALVELERASAQKEKDRTRILEEEGNIRQNISVLPANSRTREDQIKNLTDHETDLAQVNKDLRGLQAQVEAARGDLEKYLGEMSVE